MHTFPAIEIKEKKEKHIKRCWNQGLWQRLVKTNITISLHQSTHLDSITPYIELMDLLEGFLHNQCQSSLHHHHFGFSMRQNSCNRAGIESGIHCVQNSSSHRNPKVALVDSWDIRRDNSDLQQKCDSTKWFERWQ